MAGRRNNGGGVPISARVALEMPMPTVLSSIDGQHGGKRYRVVVQLRPPRVVVEGEPPPGMLEDLLPGYVLGERLTATTFVLRRADETST